MPRALNRGPMFAPTAAASARPLSLQQRDERRFLKEAAAFERFQLDAAQLALARSASPSVRSVAGSLLARQRPAGDELVRLLHQRAMAPPMLANEQRRTLNRLARLQGGRFDREFLLQVGLKSQQEEVQEYERAAATTADPALRSWIERNLPQLRYRLASAEQVAGTGLRRRDARGASAMARTPFYNGPRTVVSRPSESNSR